MFHEFQMDEDEDEPPFNFRSMLRKTDKRASLKKHRAPMTPEHSRHGTPVFNSNQLQLPTNKSARPKSNMNDRSGYDDNFNFNAESTNPSRRPSSSSEISERRDDDGNHNIDMGEYVQEEIAPGVILEGYEFNI